MTLSAEQAINIIKENPNRDVIRIKRSKSEVLKAHVTGIGDDKLIKQIKNFERSEYGNTRKELRISNRDIIDRVMQRRNKIYDAKGGVESYTMSSPKQVEDFKIYLSRIRGTQSLKDYIRQNIQPMYDYDPEGLIWLDLNNYGNPYPCFKSIQQIYDYELNGRKPEYVALALSKKEIAQLELRAEDFPDVNLKGRLITPPLAMGQKKKDNKVFRVVCDSFDRIIVWDGSTQPVIASEIPNPFAFMGVPGLVVSDIVGAGNDYEDIVYDSPLAPSLDVLNQAIFSRSLYNVAYARTAYPKEWMTKMPCPTCNGTKVLDDITCPECKGTGAMPFQMHSDVLVVDYSSDENKSTPTPPMGHTDPAVDALQFMKDNNMTWENLFEQTMWGVTKSVRNNLEHGAKGGDVAKTAYEAQLNEQPEHDRLIRFSNWYSEVSKWFVDGCGKFTYGNQYIDSAIMGGTRFMIESADATFDRLVKARNGGATKSELDSLTIEYLENKYKNNPLMYRKYYILFVAEPFYHDKISDVLTWDIPDINKKEKIFFDEWTATLTDDYFAMCPDDGLEQKVKNDLREYVLGRIKKDSEADTLLFNGDGQLLNIGDSVMVKENKAQDKSHLGHTYKVVSVGGKFVSLSNSNGSINISGYAMADLIKMDK